MFFKIRGRGIKPILLKTNVCNFVVEFTTVDTGFRRYLYSRCCRSFFHCFGLRHRLAHLAVQGPAGASCARTIFPPKSHHCGEQREREIMHVTSPHILPSLFFLVKATIKRNLKLFKVCCYVHNFSDPLLHLGHFYSLWLNCRYCFHPKSNPASLNPHLHLCRSHQLAAFFHLITIHDYIQLCL